MMQAKEIFVKDEQSTARVAVSLASRLCPGDCLLLSGQIGAGKSFFARRIIQSLQKMPEDVPSPTFTLIQTYMTERGEVWHSDLYRLRGTNELAELGLLDEMDQVISLIEWPDRMGDEAPRNALMVSFECLENEARVIRFSWQQGRWHKLFEQMSF